MDWSLPHHSRREPVLGREAVATSVPLAAQAGLEMLRRGGNAIDAAIATAACLTVVEPTSNGLGGDAFAIGIVGGKRFGLNGSGRSPALLDAERFASEAEMPALGWDPVTVPGAVRAWADLSQRFGRLPFAALLEPAIEAAEQGYLLSPRTAAAWARAAERWGAFEDFAATFLPAGRAPRPGEVVRLPDHARTLRSIAESCGRSFYEGDLAVAIDAASRRGQGSLRLEDLAAHASQWVEPLSVRFRDATLFELPPNGQGLAALVALGCFEACGGSGEAFGSVEWLHRAIESMKRGFAAAMRAVADPAIDPQAPSRELAPEAIAAAAAAIGERAWDPGPEAPLPGGTVLLCTADREGGCVSFIQSNYMGFGSGVVVPGTGIAMQNRGACFRSRPGHPNSVGPRKRPYHTIIPGLLELRAGDGGIRPMPFGVMGGFMQPQGHLQVVLEIVEGGRHPQAALDAPRWQWLGGRRVDLEAGFPPAIAEGLAARGHEIRTAGWLEDRFGRGQAILRLDEGWLAASDPRADGQAVAR